VTDCTIRNIEYLDFGKVKLLEKAPKFLFKAHELAYNFINDKHYSLTALLAYNNRKLGEGFNNYDTTHPMQLKFSNRGENRQFIHAEIHVLTKTRNIPVGSKLYIARPKCDKSWGNSRPCAGCMVALAKNNVSHTIYVHSNKFIEEDIRQYR